MKHARRDIILDLTLWYAMSSSDCIMIVANDRPSGWKIVTTIYDLFSISKYIQCSHTMRSNISCRCLLVLNYIIIIKCLSITVAMTFRFYHQSLKYIIMSWQGPVSLRHCFYCAAESNYRIYHSIECKCRVDT